MGIKARCKAWCKGKASALARKAKPKAQAWLDASMPKIEAWAEGLALRLSLLNRRVWRRYIRAWRDPEGQAVEDAARRERAARRWSAARIAPVQCEWDWALGFAEAVALGLADPWEVAGVGKVNPVQALRLGAAAACGWLFNDDAEKAGARADGHSLRMPASPMDMQMLAKRWSGSGGQLTGKAKLRRQWVAAIARGGSKGAEAMNWTGEAVGWGMPWGIVGIAAVLAALPLAALHCWLSASWRAWRHLSSAPEIRAQVVGQASRAAAEAIAWLRLGQAPEWEAEPFQDPVYEWRPEGIQARDGERLESAAWLACMAGRQLPPAERALASMCWFEAMGTVLAGPEAHRFLSGQEMAPARAMAELAADSEARHGALASEMAASGLRSPGCVRMFAGFPSGGRWRGGGDDLSDSLLPALAALAGGGQGGRSHWQGALAMAHPSMALFIAGSLARFRRDPAPTDQELMAVGLGLADNPGVDLESQEARSRFQMSDSGFEVIAAAYSARREAIQLEQSLREGGLRPEASMAAPAHGRSARRL